MPQLHDALPTVVTLAAPGRAAVVTGRVLGGLAAAFLLVDAAMKVIVIAPVVEACERLGWSGSLARPLGVLLAVCTILFAVPRTRLLGGLLLTGYLGGAVATHVRVGDPFWFPIALGAILWTSITLTDARVRALVTRSPRQ